MITALIRVTHGPEALAVTLSALVPAVAAGLLADAVILVAVPDEAIDHVAEEAGACVTLAPISSWTEGALRARRDWLLCLDDGDLPQDGWIHALDRFVALNGNGRDRARFRRRRGVFGALDVWIRPSAVRAGDLVHRHALVGKNELRSPMRLTALIERDPAFS